MFLIITAPITGYSRSTVQRIKKTFVLCIAVVILANTWAKKMSQ